MLHFQHGSSKWHLFMKGVVHKQVSKLVFLAPFLSFCLIHLISKQQANSWLAWFLAHNNLYICTILLCTRLSLFPKDLLFIYDPKVTTKTWCWKCKKKKWFSKEKSARILMKTCFFKNYIHPSIKMNNEIVFL